MEVWWPQKLLLYQILPLKNNIWESLLFFFSVSLFVGHMHIWVIQCCWLAGNFYWTTFIDEASDIIFLSWYNDKTEFYRDDLVRHCRIMYTMWFFYKNIDRNSRRLFKCSFSYCLFAGKKSKQGILFRKWLNFRLLKKKSCYFFSLFSAF